MAGNKKGNRAVRREVRKALDKSDLFVEGLYKLSLFKRIAFSLGIIFKYGRSK